MTEVNRYRDGELSSTTLMQDAMEQAHAVDPGEGKKVEWHKDHESMDQARARMHDEPAHVMEWVGGGALALLVGKAAKDGLKSSPELLNSPKQAIKDEATAAAKFAAGIAGATYATGIVGIAGVVAAGAEVAHAFGQGDQLRNRADVDALDVTVTNLLDLDPSFKSAEWKKYPGIASDRTMALFKDDGGKLTEFGKAHLPELQAAADAGARAALDALRSGAGIDAFLASRPDVKQRCADDVAFSKGFENVRYIANHGDGAEKLKELGARMDERDARNAATAVRVRG